MKFSISILFFLVASGASAFVVGPTGPTSTKTPFLASSDVNGLQQTAASASAPASSATDFVKDLLQGLAQNDGNTGGKKLLENSSHSWRTAIYDAVGAPPTADEKIVAKALTDAMSCPKNQFAILLGKAEETDFSLEFPSDPVEYAAEGDDPETSFVEVRLRNNSDDELLVTMGIQLQRRNEDGHWLVSKLDWQDFRDQFYPGLSGREWLRAF